MSHRDALDAPANHSRPNFDFAAFVEEQLKLNNLYLTPEQTFKLARVVIQVQDILNGAAIEHRHTRELCALTEHLVRFCAGPATEDPVLMADCVNCVPEEHRAGRHCLPPSLPPEPWSDAEHHAGYRAFYSQKQFDYKASSSWQQGWQDASLELDHEQLDLLALNELPSPALYGVYGPGDFARDLGLRFDDCMDPEWKAAWVRRDTELALGVIREWPERHLGPATKA